MANDSLKMGDMVQDTDVGAGLVEASVSQCQSSIAETKLVAGAAHKLAGSRKDDRPQRTETIDPADQKEILLQIMFESELYEYLLLSEGFEDFERRVTVLVNKLGFSDFIFTLMDTVTSVDGKLYTIPKELIEIYCEKEFYKHDLMLQYLTVCPKPNFRSAIDNFIANSPFPAEIFIQNHDFSMLLKSYGYMDYYVSPVSSESGGQGLLFIMSRDMDVNTFRHKVEVCKGRLELLCCAIDHICSTRFAANILKGKTKEYRLTPRPLELLTYMSMEDCTLYKAAKKMNISVKTANVHIAAVKREFGVSTSTAAVTHAIKYGLINFDG